MNSLAFSIGNYTAPTKLNKIQQICCNQIDNKKSNQKMIKSSNEQVKDPQRRKLLIEAAVVVALAGRNSAKAAESFSCELSVASSGLAFCDKVVGTGPQPLKGQLIKAHYVGKLENGKVFDSSYNRGKPLTFRVGVGEVIKGWDEGIIGGDGIPPMQAGGKRILKIPAQLAYGVRGAGCKGGSCIIPPDSILLFEVEFIGKA